MRGMRRIVFWVIVLHTNTQLCPGGLTDNNHHCGSFVWFVCMFCTGWEDECVFICVHDLRWVTIAWGVKNSITLVRLSLWTYVCV